MGMTHRERAAYRRANPEKRAAENARRRELYAEKKAAAKAASVGLSKGPIKKRPGRPVKTGTKIARWAKANLIIPHGLPGVSGKPLALQKWQVDWLNNAFAPGVYTAGLSVARKNGKSFLIAVACLAHLLDDSPDGLNEPNWRGLAVSLTARHANELRDLMIETAAASGLELKERRSPYPGAVIGKRNARVDFWAAEKGGHSASANLAIIDEAGLLDPAKYRPLWDGVARSTSSRDGRLFCISVRGTSELFSEVANRAHFPDVYWKEYRAPDKSKVTDRKAWHLANPGLGQIKGVRYMESGAQEALANAAAEPGFMVYDLNMPVDPDRQNVVSLSAWNECLVDELPPRLGPCFFGIDLGGSSSMTAGAIFYPATRRLEVYGAFPGSPSLKLRSKADGVPGVYEEMLAAGEISVYDDATTTPVGLFLEDMIARIGDADRVFVGADRYRASEAYDELVKAGKPHWPIEWMGMGAGKTDKHVSGVVREFQKGVLSREIKAKRTLLMTSAIAESEIKFDAHQNVMVDKSRAKGRIDALSATILAVGLGRLYKPSEFAVSSTRKTRLKVV